MPWKGLVQALEQEWGGSRMARFVWCKNVECRIPSFRCLLCNQNCYADEYSGEAAERAFAELLRTGKYRERFVMKRKTNVAVEDTGVIGEAAAESAGGEGLPESSSDGRIFILEEGVLKPFRLSDYAPSVLYQVMEEFQVESRLVRPEEPGNIIFEGKRPARKTLPILVSRSGEAVLFDSWESLESNPQALSDSQEVLGASPVKQVFVLRRKTPVGSSGKGESEGGL